MLFRGRGLRERNALIINRLRCEAIENVRFEW